MYLLAHTGLTVGAAYLVEQAVRLGRKSRPLAVPIDNAAGASYSPPQGDTGALKTAGQTSPFPIDYRFILLGSLLPDIIDKPLGIILLPQALANGRTFCHTLLFLALTIIVGLVVLKAQKKWWGLFIAFGVLTHFIMDAMWLDPVTLYWPFYAPAFAKHPGMTLGTTITYWVKALEVEPRIYIPEIVGFIVLSLLTVKVIVQKRVRAFILTGSL